MNIEVFLSHRFEFIKCIFFNASKNVEIFLDRFIYKITIKTSYKYILKTTYILL